MPINVMSSSCLLICHKEHIWLHTPDPQTTLQLLFILSQKLAQSNIYLEAGSSEDLEKGLKKKQKLCFVKIPVSPSKLACPYAPLHACHCLTWVTNCVLTSVPLTHSPHFSTPPGLLLWMLRMQVVINMFHLTTARVFLVAAAVCVCLVWYRRQQRNKKKSLGVVL